MHDHDLGHDVPDESVFEDASISRRQFVRLSAATGGALALPGAATAVADSDAFDAEYQYVLNHTPEDFAVPTLIEFSDQSGLAAFEAMGMGENVHTTTEPTTAGYAQLTTAEAQQVAELPTAAELSHSPGSNPFWRIGYYPMGVFPEPRRSTEFVDYEQMIDGLRHLEDEYRGEPGSPDLRAYSIGTSPGHYNYISDRDDPKGVWVAEVTNDIDDAAAFDVKEKVFYSLSLHGLERAGAEAGSRFIEQLLRGEEAEIEDLLDDVVLIFCFTNPDGWVAKHPQYGSNWQLGEIGPIEEVPAAPFYKRGNAEVFDTNRQYPTVGYITTEHYPGEPDDPADRSLEKVTDALAIVDHFRDYENLNYGADMHGMLNSSQFVLGLISQDQFDTRDLHELYEMNLLIDEVLGEELGNWETLAEVLQPVTDEHNPRVLGWKTLPETAYDYSTIWDTLGYTVSGALGDWMAHPEELGGLGMTTMDFEMAYSHMVGANVYNPELVEMQNTGYQTAIRAIATYAYQNSDTPNSADDFDARTVTGGESVAYVTTGAVGTDEDALRRHDGQLEFVVFDDLEEFQFEGVIGPGVDSGMGTTSRQEHPVTAPEGAERIDASASWGANVQDNELLLENADGDLIASSTNPSGPEHITQSIDPGEEYVLVIETWANAVAPYEITGAFQREVPSRDDEDGTGVVTRKETTTKSLDAGGAAVATHDVEAADLHSFTVHLHAEQALFETQLVSPSGEVVRSFDPVQADRIGGRCCGHPEWDLSEPEPGTWTVRIDNVLEQPQAVEVQFGTLQSETRTPDPVPALGYEQQSYDVTPFRFFEDYAEYIAEDDAGTFTAVTTADVANGALVDGGEPAYDHVVVIHDAINPPNGAWEVDTASYLQGLDEYVDDGGNLVLTDSGVRLLSGLNNTLVGGIGFGDLVERIEDLSHLGDKDLEHPLLTDVKPIQKALWKVAPLGYKTSGESPMYMVDAEAFASAPGDGDGTPSIAATTGGDVSLGSVTRGEADGTGVHVVGGLLPPAKQENFHPFGLLDYTTSFLGYLVFTSALGFRQERELADGTVRSFGRGDQWTFDDDDDGDDAALDAKGNREVDSSVELGRNAYQVDVTLHDLSGDVDEVELYDEIPEEWRLFEQYSDARTTDDDGRIRLVKRNEDREVVADTFGPGDADEEGDSITFTYFLETPDELTDSNVYEIGPAEAVAGEESDAFADAEEVTVVAVDI